MDQWTPGQLTAVIAGVSALLTALIGAMFSDKVVAALKARAEHKRQVAADRRQEQEKNRQLDEQGHKRVIRLLDQRVTDLQSRCDLLAAEHLDCQTQLAELRAKYEAVVTRVKKLENHAGDK